MSTERKARSHSYVDIKDHCHDIETLASSFHSHQGHEEPLNEGEWPARNGKATIDCDQAMEPIIDPSTGAPLPPDTIQRVLFVCGNVHVYQIPPLSSTKGYNASNWTDPKRPTAQQIFTGRLRVLETAIPAPTPSSVRHSATQGDAETVKIDILLEDPNSGQLFAAAPYTAPGVVEQALDSTRFFAVTVRGEGGRKAVLGVGFEERSEAFDFGVCLQEVRKVQGMGEGNEQSASGQGKKKAPKVPAAGASGLSPTAVEDKHDFALKEGQMITVNLGGNSAGSRGGKAALQSPSTNSSASGSAPMPFLPPPPSARDVKADRRRSQREASPNPVPTQAPTAKDLGFNDGEFGEFQ